MPYTYDDIIKGVSESQPAVERALAELIKRKLIYRKGELYQYSALQEAEEVAQKLFTLYEQLNKPETELFIRGLLCQPGQPYMTLRKVLIAATEKEGLMTDEVTKLIQSDIQQSYIITRKLAFVVESIFLPPNFIPEYYVPHFRKINQIDYQRLEEKFDHSEFRLIVEDYLISRYPAEIARQSADYILRKRADVWEAIKTTASPSRGLFGVVWGHQPLAQVPLVLLDN